MQLKNDMVIVIGITKLMRRGTFKQLTYDEKLEKAKSAQIRRQKSISTKVSSKGVKSSQKGKSKAKKVSSKSLHTKVWKLCREIIIGLYGNTCYTTYVTGLDGSNLHISHLIAKAALPIKYKYDLRLLRPASYHSNINLSGDTHNYLEHYLSECNITHVRWEEFRKEIKTSPIVKTNDYLQYLITHYTAILDQINTFPERKEDFKRQYTRLI